MSATTTPPTTTVTQSAAPLPVDQLWTPQTIIALAFVLIAAGCVAAVFAMGEVATRSQTIGAVMSIASMVAGFYFGSSRGSQAKDQAQTAPAATGTTTTTVVPASTTTIVQPASPVINTGTLP